MLRAGEGRHGDAATRKLGDTENGRRGDGAKSAGGAGPEAAESTGISIPRTLRRYRPLLQDRRFRCGKQRAGDPSPARYWLSRFGFSASGPGKESTNLLIQLFARPPQNARGFFQTSQSNVPRSDLMHTPGFPTPGHFRLARSVHWKRAMPTPAAKRALCDDL